MEYSDACHAASVVSTDTIKAKYTPGDPDTPASWELLVRGPGFDIRVSDTGTYAKIGHIFTALAALDTLNKS